MRGRIHHFRTTMASPPFLSFVSWKGSSYSRASTGDCDEAMSNESEPVNEDVGDSPRSATSTTSNQAIILATMCRQRPQPRIAPSLLSAVLAHLRNFEVGDMDGDSAPASIFLHHTYPVTRLFSSIKR